MKHRAVHVRWVDSHSPSDYPWIDPDAIDHGTLAINSVGYVIKETKKNLTLASSVADGKGGQVSGVITIPTCAILKRKKLS